MEMPKPGDAHTKLARMAGVWTGEETMHASEWIGAGSVSEAQNEYRVALDGFVVIGEYEQRRGGKVTFSGHAVYTYDAKQQCYVLYWFDCMGTPPNVFTGNFDGDVLSLSCEVEAPSGPRHTRIVTDMSQIDAGKMVGWMETSADGKDWKRMMDGTYARQS